MSLPVLILAAGFGRRMGGPKALLQVGGETLLQRAVRRATEAGCAPILAVVGPWDPGPVMAQVVVNAAPEEGMASSLRAGFAALPPDAPAALVMVVDQPAVDAELLRRLLDLAALDPERPAACAYGDSLGIPAVVPRRLFPAIQALRGDRGAKAILLPEHPATLPFPEGVTDLDTPEDLSRLQP